MSVQAIQEQHRRPSAAPAPLRPCTVRLQECADPWDTTGQSGWLEWFAYNACTGQRIARSLYRNTLDDLLTERGYEAVSEAEAATLPEPRICVAPRPSAPPLRWRMVPVAGGYGYAAVDVATGAAFADSWHPTVLRDAVARYFPQAVEVAQ